MFVVDCTLHSCCMSWTWGLQLPLHCVQLQFVVSGPVSGQWSLHSGHHGQQHDVCKVLCPAPILDSQCGRQMVLSESNPCVQSVQWSVVTTDDVITVTVEPMFDARTMSVAR